MGLTQVERESTPPVTRKHGIYLAGPSAFQSKTAAGIARKIRSQIAVLSEHFSVALDTRMASAPLLSSRIRKALPWTSHYRWLRLDHRYEKASFVYVRFDGADRLIVDFFRRLKERVPNILVLIEFPTYPSERTASTARALEKFYWKKDRHWQPKLASFVDNFVTYSDVQEIMGVPTLRVANGVEVDRVPERRQLRPASDSTIRLIAVASMSYWQGYDRLLEGMASYYAAGGARQIELDLVGVGSEIERYRTLARIGGLEGRVRFRGTVTGSALDNLFDEADVAVSSLGRHRTPGVITTTLKSREYLARGIPMVGADARDLFDGRAEPYTYLVAATDELIDMNELVVFADSVKVRPLEATRTLRSLARQIADMRVVMEPIAQRILEG
jgi:hypothetical protein